MEKGKSPQVSSTALPSSSTVSAHEINDDNRVLWCLVAGESEPFSVTAPLSNSIYQLKLLVHKERDKGVLRHVNAADLVLLKVSLDLNTPGVKSLGLLEFNVDNHGVEPLTVWKLVSDYWSSQPPVGHIHIFVDSRTTATLKRLRSSSPENMNLVKRRKDQVSYQMSSPFRTLMRFTWTLLERLFVDDPELDDLRRLWHKLWVAKEDPFEEHVVHRDSDRVVDVEVPEKCRVLCQLPNVFRYGDVLVRQEYDEALEAIQDLQATQKSVVVVGHPGIGKTIFLYYLLVRRLLLRQSTLFQYEDESILLFDENGVTRLSPKSVLTQSSTSTTWALIDANTSALKPAKMLLRDGSPFFTVVASSLRSGQWEKVTHYQVPFTLWFMKPFTLGELIQARHLQVFRRNEQQLQQFFDIYGPSARDCYAFCAQLSSYRSLVEDKIKTMTWTTIIDALKGAHTLRLVEGSHKVILMAPDSENREIYSPRIITKAVSGMLCEQDTSHRWRNAHILYQSMRLDPKTKSSAGWLLEPPLHALCVKGTTFQVYEMKRTSGGPVNNIFTKVGHTNQQSLFLPPQELVLFDKSHPIEALQPNHYYQPIHGTQATFDSFIYDPIFPRITLIQVTDGEEHSVKLLGINFVLELVERLQLPAVTLRFVVVIPEGDQVRCVVPKVIGVPLEMFFLEVSEADLFP